MRKTSTTLSFRISKELREEFERYALLSHTTTKEILMGYIYDLLNIAKEEQFRNIKCIVCGKTFQTNNPVRKFCSAECRKKK